MTDSLLVQLRKGVLDMCVLALLERSDGYAYDIASRLAEAIGMGGPEKLAKRKAEFKGK